MRNTWKCGELSPCRAPNPFPILFPSAFVPENEVSVVKALTFTFPHPPEDIIRNIKLPQVTSLVSWKCFPAKNCYLYRSTRPILIPRVFPQTPSAVLNGVNGQAFIQIK